MSTDTDDPFTRRQLLGLIGATAVLGAGGKEAEGATEERGERRHPIKASLSTRLTEEYGIPYPITNAAMGFVGQPELAIAVSNAGGMGFIGASPEPPLVVRTRIAAVQAGTKNPFGVGFIIASSPLGDFVTQDHIDLCAAARVKVVSFHWDVPPASWVEQLHAAGTKVWVQAHSVDFAMKAVDVGVDAIIAQGVEAGGHNRNSVLPTEVLLSHISRTIPKKTLLLAAGGIANGVRLAQAILAGADGAWVGTRFVASAESYANQSYKDRLVVAGEDATTFESRFGPEWPGQQQRVLKVRAATEPVTDQPSVIGHTTLFPGEFNRPYDMPKYSAIVPTRDTTGDLEQMDMPAGSESTVLIHTVKPAAQIIADMVKEANVVLNRARG